MAILSIPIILSPEADLRVFATQVVSTYSYTEAEMPTCYAGQRISVKLETEFCAAGKLVTPAVVTVTREVDQWSKSPFYKIVSEEPERFTSDYGIKVKQA